MSNTTKQRQMAPRSTHSVNLLLKLNSLFISCRVFFLSFCVICSLLALALRSLLFASICINNSSTLCVVLLTTFSLHQRNGKSYVLLSAHCWHCYHHTSQISGFFSLSLLLSVSLILHRFTFCISFYLVSCFIPYT